MGKFVRILLGSLLALIVVAGLVVLVVHLTDDDDEKDSKARIVSIGELQKAARDSKSPIYWAGDPRDFSIELSQVKDSSYVRYLSPGVKAGNKRPDYLTVGTYPFKDAYADLLKNAKRNGDSAVTKSVPGSGRLLYYKERPTSVYLSYPNASYLIEVYDPRKGQALKLARSGDVRPVP